MSEAPAEPFQPSGPAEAFAPPTEPSQAVGPEATEEPNDRTPNGTSKDGTPGATTDDSPEGTPAADAEPGPEPLGVDVAETGNAEVDAVLRRLADADELPTDGHVEVYEDVHTGLRGVLAALDTPVGPRPPQAPFQNRS
ncbi:hypothetical protein [Wenjunlia tyrosinilytica]|uniref:Uncharacterized protein n=1 Tax=Wenjunlia tyrosinilytica TaxID=1544741 RepID=A0A918E147_9ACTN|nr:hypothetical protein [Wenjunlia tyrosinilytica]GGO95177.1 hypothetical protein GCM10012280_51760 [Wenjunlia tyrosinilytica]